MTQPPRQHLAERAAQAMGGLNLSSPPPVAEPLATPAGTPLARPLAAALRRSPPDEAPPPSAEMPAAHPAPSSSPGTITLATLQEAGLVTQAAARSRLFEEIAVVQDQVVRTVHATTAVGGRHPRVVLVTSALPGEGKSFMALNIAAAMAAARGQPVLLVDGDGKRGSLTEALGCAGRAGLGEIAAEPDRPLAPAVVLTERDRLGFVPFGAARPSGAGIAGAALRLAEAHPRHIVILDMPPTLATSESSALAPVAGQIIMVVEAERTQRGQVEAALDLLDTCPTIQLVLNKVHMQGDERFGTYGYDG